MKKIYSTCFFIMLFFSCEVAFAQNAEMPVKFAAGDFITGNNIQRNVFQKEQIQNSLLLDKYYGLVQFSKLPSLAEKEYLRTMGLDLGIYVPGNAYLATIDNGFNFTVAGSFNILSVNSIPAFYKVDPQLAAQVASGSLNSDHPIAVQYYETVGKTTTEAALINAGAVILQTRFTLKNVVLIRADKNIVNTIAQIPFVSFINLQSITDRTLNYKSVGLHGVSSLLSAPGRNLSGKGIYVGVGDNSEIFSPSTNIDFTNRVVNRVPFPFSFHGIHVSGTVAGGGLINPLYNGMAPRAGIVSQWFSDIITNTPTYVADYNMVVTNNSYTASDTACGGNSIYDALSNYTDNQMRDYPTVLHVVSAGNDGSYTCSPFPMSYATIKSGYQCAKNVLTVGAIDQLNCLVANFSSRGPVQDGRIKPEIVANGVGVISTRHFNLYVGNSGTSMSGPVVAGTATLLNEQYRKSNGGATPKASLIKAVLCNTAEDLGNPGPDFTFGFGNLNAGKAVSAIENNRFYFSSAASSVNTIVVPSGVRRLKVMLYWADTAASPLSASTLINDYDLTVTAPGPVTHLPLILNPAAGNVTNIAVQGIDRVNNIEQVVIDNPAPGNYDLNVNAFALPYGAWEYVVTYQMDMNGVIVDFPFGGEKLVPAETEIIRWTAEGDNSNSFTIEYFDGTVWNLIDNNVVATARQYNWVVPATVGNNYRIRVNRNASAYTDQSDFDFTIIGQPVPIATVPCPGFAQLDWPAVTGAISYDIWQQQGDTMGIIGNTNSLTYLISGLSSNTSYWFAVSANNGTVKGRRSIAKTVTPTTGPCTLASFDNNLKADSVIAPISGRQFTTTSLTASEQIRFRIRNLDNAATSGLYDLYYQINANPVVMESSSAIIASLGTGIYQFSTLADLSVPGVYIIRAWVKRSGDTQPLDDTVSVTLKHLANPALTLPVLDDFESVTTMDYLVNTTGFENLDRADFKSSSVRGRARTFVNSGFAYSGSKAVTLDQFPYSATNNADSLLMTYNMSSYTGGEQLRIDFYYKNHGVENMAANKVWIRGSYAGTWVLAYDLVANQAALGGWKHAVINVNDVLSAAVPPQTVSASFQIKLGQEGNTSANIPYPFLDQDDGYTFDNIGIKQAVIDISIVSINSPVASGCNMAGIQTVSLQIKNHSSSTFANVPVTYRINAGTPVTEIIASLPPGNLIFNFAATVNLVTDTDYSFDFWLHEPTDNYNLNDSVLNYNFRSSQLVNVFPYLQGFETNSGGWYARGLNSSWQLGTPANATIGKAANGTQAWVTSLTGKYNNNELSYLYSPCFDLTGMTQPVLSFSHIFKIQDGTPADYNWVEYSDNGGITWTRLGANAVGTNWYNDATGKKQWRTSLSTWHVASTDIPTTAGNVRFRFVMSSDFGFALEGVGIDDIHIFDKRVIYNSTPITNITQSVSGSNWVHFNSGSAQRVVSINANNNNLGNTTVAVYPFTGAVRFKNGQYYVNRNIVIRPTTQPSSNVSVRFYFTDAEAKSILAASGCVTCTKPKDPYDLGVTKFSGTAIQENGTLDDNAGGSYWYILPANTEIIPYDNGYYAEFPVNSFSEFWLNDGGIGGIHPLPINLLTFEAIKQNKKVLLQWTTDNELNADKYIVERSADGINYTGIGSLFAFNNSQKNNYSLTDLQPLSGLNLYRLKMLDKDGSFRYSPIRKINFSSDADDITVYPNPVFDGKVFIASSGNINSAVLFDAAGKTIRSFILQGRSNELDLKGIARGTYQLKINSDKSVHTEKILIQ